jgi:RNA polymerase sigma-70 factor (ECF subfamily)
VFTAVAMTEPAPVSYDVETIRDAVRRAQAGDADAFEIVYRAHAGRVYSVCLRMTGDAVQAGELLQDVFVRVWEKLGTFRGESAFGTWLHRLAVNLVLMDRRTAARRAEDSLVNEEGVERSLPVKKEAPAGLRLDLEQCIAALPPMARQVLVLYDIEGYEHQEIGTMLGIAEGTSKAHLFRARRILREALER